MKVLLIFLLTLSLSACKSQKESSANDKQNSSNGTENQSDKSVEQTMPNVEIYTLNNLSQQPDSFRVVVSFISIGGGTDPQANELLSNYLSAYTEKSGKRISYAKMPWGREGEVDNCFTLKELTPSEQIQFVEGLKTALANRDLIQIIEFMKNRMKR